MQRLTLAAEDSFAPPPGLLRTLVFFHESQSLGAGRSVLGVVDKLSEYGWTSNGWFPGEGPIVESARQTLECVAVVERPIAHSLRGWRSQPGWRSRGALTPGYFRAVRGMLLTVRPHVVHANTLLCLPEATVARSCGLPVVLQVHEIPPPGNKRTATIRLAARVADVLVAVSDAVAEVVSPHAGKTPVLTVKNGVTATTASNTADARDDRPFTVGTVATVSRVKGTDVFLRAGQLAARAMPDIRVEHVGSPHLHTDVGLDDELSLLLEDPVLRAVTSMRGQQTAADLLDGWDIYISASRSEAFPLGVLEAMAAGLPVIATAVGGVPEQIEHLRTGILVEPDDPEAIASWIERLRVDSELRLRLGAAGAERVRTHFTLAAQAEGLHRAYLTALNLRFGPPVVRERTRQPS